MPVDLVGALTGWLVAALGDSGIQLVRGNPDRRVLRRAMKLAIAGVVDQAEPAVRETLEAGLRRCFSSVPALPLDVSVSVGEGLKAAIAVQIAGLDQWTVQRSSQLFLRPSP